MEILVLREPHDNICMLGTMHVETYTCQTLEDIPRAVKVPGRTAIPAGRYEIAVNWSQRFLRRMPLLLNVPNFEGVRIHPGNTAADTEGCILVGLYRQDHALLQSRPAFETVFTMIDRALEKEKVWITLRDAVSTSNVNTN